MSKRKEPVGVQLILAAARHRFLQWGYSATSTAALAEDLGITKAALYYHFTDKEALFLAVVKDYLEAIAVDLAEVADAFEADDGRSALEALARVFLSRNDSSARIQQVALQESRHLTAEGRKTLAATYHDLLARPVASQLERAAQRGWIRLPHQGEPPLIWIFLGLLSSYLQPEHGDGLSLASSAESFVRLFLGGLRPE